jgi:hypothetical protein
MAPRHFWRSSEDMRFFCFQHCFLLLDVEPRGCVGDRGAIDERRRHGITTLP